jgi:hypothetical protein
MPAAKTMYAADEAKFGSLREQLKTHWLPAMQQLVDVSDEELPVLWDADFLYGPRNADGSDSYMLCEINVSSVIPFPDPVPMKVAAALKRRSMR